MDSSLGKAIIMVASLLLAMIVIGFMTFTFNRTGTWASAQDEQKLAEQRDKFNKEYEAYDKDLMYGVDVISCLNKVLSNNEKIVKKGYVNGEQYDVSYAIEAKIKINNDLSEKIIVYRSNGTGKEEETSNWDSQVQIKDMKDSFSFPEKSKFKSNSISYLKTCVEKSEMTSGEYSLTYNGEESEKILRSYLKNSDKLSQTVKNKNIKETTIKDGEYKGYFWSKAVYQSALYDLKTRKFTCKKLEYNADTGRVNYIEFKEI